MQYFLVIKCVDGRRYGYEQSSSVARLIIVSTLAMSLLLALSYYVKPLIYYPVAGFLTAALCGLYLSDLNQKTGLLHTIKEKLRG